MMEYMNWRGKILIGMAVSIYVLMSVWLFWPYKPIEMHGIYVLNIDKEVKRGGVLQYNFEYSKAKKYPVIAFSKQLINGHIITLSPPKGDLPVAEHQKKIVNLAIPKIASPGIYVLHISAAYRVNPIRIITVAQTSDEFEIL